MPRITCNICKSEQRSAMEALGLQVQAGQATWNSAAREWSLSDPRSLKNHMEKHYVAVDVEAEDEFLAMVQQTYREIVAEAQLTLDPHRRSELLEEAHNVRGLPHTKASQENLQRIRKERREAQKTATQLELMVAFGAQAFRQLPQPVEPITLEILPGDD